MKYKNPEMFIVIFDDEEIVDTLVNSPGVPGGNNGDGDLKPEEILPV